MEIPVIRICCNSDEVVADNGHWSTLCGWCLVDPVNRYPLMLRAQFLDRSTQFVVRLVHVVVDNHLVEVLLVLPLDACALVKRAPKVVLLQQITRQS